MICFDHVVLIAEQGDECDEDGKDHDTASGQQNSQRPGRHGNEVFAPALAPRRRILQLLPKLMRGSHVGEAEIMHASVQRVTVTAAAAVPSHLDGEVQPLQSEFEFEVLPDALQLL